MDESGVFPGGVIGRARRGDALGVTGCGHDGQLMCLDSTLDEQTPGPAEYDMASYKRSLTPRSARMGKSSRDTSWYLDAQNKSPLRSSPSGRNASPGPQHYDTEAVSRKMSPRARSARMTCPRASAPVTMTSTGMMCKGLGQDQSPGPAAYSPRGNSRTVGVSDKVSALFGREERNVSEWFGPNGAMLFTDVRGTPGMLRSKSANARMMEQRRIAAQEEDSATEVAHAAPGPATYYTESHGRAISARGSARLNVTPRRSEQWLEHRKGHNTPGPATYDAQGAWQHSTGKKAPCANVTPPRRPCNTRQGELLVHNLNSSQSPGPGAYNPVQRRGGLLGRVAGVTTPRRTKSQPRVRFDGLQTGPSPRSRRGWEFQNDHNTSSSSLPAPREDMSRSNGARSLKSDSSAPELGSVKKSQESAWGAPAAREAENRDKVWRRPSYLRPTFSSRRKADIVAGVRSGNGATPHQSFEQTATR